MGEVVRPIERLPGGWTDSTDKALDGLASIERYAEGNPTSVMINSLDMTTDDKITFNNLTWHLFTQIYE